MIHARRVTESESPMTDVRTNCTTPHVSSLDDDGSVHPSASSRTRSLGAL